MDFARERFAQFGDVLFVDVARVFAQVHHNVVRPGGQAHGRGVYRVRPRRAARLAQRSDVINIYP